MNQKPVPTCHATHRHLRTGGHPLNPSDAIAASPVLTDAELDAYLLRTGSSGPSDDDAELEKQAVPYSHYFKNVQGLVVIDVYRVIELWQVPAGPLDHALKKILNLGQRGGKDAIQDITEARDSLNRWLEMRSEDAALGR